MSKTTLPTTNTTVGARVLDQAFLAKLTKKYDSVDGISLDSDPPRYWFSTGNASLNKVISNNYFKGIPQGRVTGIAGPSGSGKSFIASNCMREAQKAGAFVLSIDSENAIDDGFVSAVGVDPHNNYQYVSVSTIPQVSMVVSEFVKGYKSMYGTDADAPKVLIVIDSLDMLLTDSELENYTKGDTKGDQGQRAKQLKAMLRTFVQDIKDLNISMICTTQVYQATQQQILAGEGVWVINGAVRYALSQLILCTRLKLKDKETKIVSGIRMKCEAFKTRFSKPFQSVTIEVPYDTGMNFYSGIFEILKDNNLLTEGAGGRYSLTAHPELAWRGKDNLDGDMAARILQFLDEHELTLKVTDPDAIGTLTDGDD